MTTSLLKDNLHARLASILGDCAATKGFPRRAFAELARLVEVTHLGDDELTILLNLSSEVCERISRDEIDAKAGTRVVRLLAIIVGMPDVADGLDPDKVVAMREGMDR